MARAKTISEAFTPRRLRSLRKRLGVTQAQLAAELLTTTVTIGRWENGQGVPDTAKRRRLQELADGTRTIKDY